MARKKKLTQTTEQEYQKFFDSHVKEADDGSGCYLWTAAKNNIGYGFFRYHDRMQTAHRVALKLLGQNVDGKVVYHSCDNYHCVNPQHLNVGTNHDKAAVAVSKGRLGTICTDPAKFATCKYCGVVSNKLVIGHVHNEKCKHKPKPAETHK
jgi:hypothetical protein